MLCPWRRVEETSSPFFEYHLSKRCGTEDMGVSDHEILELVIRLRLQRSGKKYDVLLAFANCCENRQHWCTIYVKICIDRRTNSTH